MNLPEYPCPQSIRLVRRANAGFSLIELLTVVAIMAVLIGLGATVVRNSGKYSARTAAEGMVNIMENARTQAVVGNTFVRVALAPLPANHQGYPGTAVITLASSDGTNTTDATAWRVIGKPIALPGILLEPGGAGTESLAGNDLPSFSERAWGGDVNFANGVLYAPSGCAFASSDLSVERFLSFSLRRENGNEPPSNITIAALSGAISLVSR